MQKKTAITCGIMWDIGLIMGDDVSLNRTSRFFAREILANIIAASLMGYFVYVFALDFINTFRISSLLLLTKVSLDAGFFLFRKFPEKVSFSFYSWMAAFCGIVTPLLLRPYGNNEYLVASSTQFVGVTLQIIAMLSLNRSFGVVPALRGVKQGGLYRFVRHPLYGGAIIVLAGFLINNASLYNAIVSFAAVGFQVLRIFREEEFLKQDAEYRSYADKTRWRMVPYIF